MDILSYVMGKKAGGSGGGGSSVTIVSFAEGTDDEVAAMIDAARAGTIDLQTDGGWAVGDRRTIHVEAFTGGNSTAHAAQDIDIVISQFGDYNDCGCLFQFDFVDCLSEGEQLNSTATNEGGYGATKMYTATLPAMVEALPAWLQSRLKTFDVLASAGDLSTEIVNVSGNKLALRSEVEIFGEAKNSVAGEGTQIPYYQTAANRSKKRGSGSAINWWTRSPHPTYRSEFCIYHQSGAMSADATADGRWGLSPFGCI